MRIFVATRGYPSPDWLYNYPFVHRRVLDFEALGHDVSVFVLKRKGPAAVRTYEGVTVHEGGDDDLVERVSAFAPDCVAAHSIADDFWPGLSRLPASLPIFGWIHGAEILSYYRTTQRPEDEERAANARRTFERRIGFWKSLLPDWPRNLHLVFLSQDSAREAFENLGASLPERSWSVIHQPIDTELFSYLPKSPEDRFRILSIRPFNDWRYANELSVEAIRILSSESVFPRMEFRFVGDGRLFDEVLAPIRTFPNVTCEQRFLAQHEVAALHREYGVFLAPTRHDAQGVSRDEAMSSGLVPITNAVAAIPEFVDAECGGLAPRDDANAMANHLLEMALDPELFLRRSRAAAERVRARLAASIVVPQELELMKTAPQLR